MRICYAIAFWCLVACGSEPGLFYPLDATVPDTEHEDASGTDADVQEDTMPDVDDTTPDAEDTTPDADDTTPDVEDTPPDVEDTTSDAADTTPDVEDTTPDVADTTPDVEDTTPDVEDTTPDVEDTTLDVPDADGDDAVDTLPDDSTDGTDGDEDLGDGDLVEGDLVEGDLGDGCDPNACGGCEELDLVPGTACGTCGSGTIACVSDDAVACEGDLEDAARNACGGCDELPADPGEACGAFGLGELACEGEEALTCARNDCHSTEFTGALGRKVSVSGFASLSTFTFEAWVLWYGPVVDWHVIATRSFGDADADAIRLQIRNDAALRFGPRGTDVATASDAVSTGEWMHVAAVTRGGTRWLYLNGVLADTEESDIETALEPGDIVLGTGCSPPAGCEGAYRLNGAIHSARLSFGERYTDTFVPAALEADGTTIGAWTLHELDEAPVDVCPL